MVLAFNPDDIKNPFQIKKVTLQDSQGQYSGPIYSFDFTDAKITFFAEILDDIEEPYLKARLADLLWLHYKLNKYNDKPKQHEYAKQAIEAYTSHKINTQTWFNNVDKCWNRAIRLCLQIKDDETKNELTDRLFAAFNQDYPDHKFMHLSLAQLLDKLKIDEKFRTCIAIKLWDISCLLALDNDFSNAKQYLNLTSKKYKQISSEHSWMNCLVLDGLMSQSNAYVCFSKNKMIVANDLYNEALRIYKQIPKSYRSEYAIDDQILEIEEKIAETRTALSYENKNIMNKHPDTQHISEMMKVSAQYMKVLVEHASDIKTVLLAFTLQHEVNLSQGSRTESLAKHVQALARRNNIPKLVPTKMRDSDGRTIAKAPGINFNKDENDFENHKAIRAAMYELSYDESNYLVKSYILPALKQLKEEHEFTFSKVELLCKRSNFVPDDRAQLMTCGLLYGFQHNFAQAIYLLVPQFENCVRIQLQKRNINTIHTAEDGIENEKSLNKLMELDQIEKIFDQDVIFEIKSIFTEPIGFNMRNRLAHGLLDDGESASLSSIYAWWMILRLVISPYELPHRSVW